DLTPVVDRGRPAWTPAVPWCAAKSPKVGHRPALPYERVPTVRRRVPLPNDLPALVDRDRVGRPPAGSCLEVGGHPAHLARSLWTRRGRTEQHTACCYACCTHDQPRPAHLPSPSA